MCAHTCVLPLGFCAHEGVPSRARGPNTESPLSPRTRGFVNSVSWGGARWIGDMPLVLKQYGNMALVLKYFDTQWFVGGSRGWP
jgi:hypothetical protein